MRFSGRRFGIEMQVKHLKGRPYRIVAIAIFGFLFVGLLILYSKSILLNSDSQHLANNPTLVPVLESANGRPMKDGCWQRNRQIRHNPTGLNARW